MNSLLEVTNYTEPVKGIADRLTFGGFILLLGMAIVFAVLIVIWASLAVFKLYFTKNENKPVAAPAPVVAPAPIVTDDGEIIAVIAAAIAAAEADSDGIKFKVVSFRRK